MISWLNLVWDECPWQTLIIAALLGALCTTFVIFCRSEYQHRQTKRQNGYTRRWRERA